MKRKILFMISIFFISINLVYANDKVTFSKCVDGDTIKVILNDKEETIRLLAIDTPESTKRMDYYGKESSEYTCKKVKAAKKIELEYDEASDKRDKYDRLLAWVFIDDKLLQKDLVAKGYAKVAYLYGDYKYTDTLNKKQELASAKNLGVWDTIAEKQFNKNNSKIDTKEEYTMKEIIIIALLLLIIVYISDKTIKTKAKKKLESYL